MKRCSKCGQEKPKTEFHNDKNRLDGLYCYCKICKNADNKKYPIKKKDAIWKFHGIKNSDGSFFTTNDYNRAFQIQGGRCAGCKRHQSETKKVLFADHNHTTGIFRGLLCHPCNIKVDSMSTPELLRALADYIESNSSKNTRRIERSEDVLRTVK